MIKKILKHTLLTLFIFFGLCSFSFAQLNEYNFEYPYPEGNFPGDTPTCTDWDCSEFIPQTPIDDQDSIMGQLLSIFWLNNDALSWDHKFIKYVRWILNIALWVLSQIALIMTIYTFYMMYFSDNEAGTKRAKQNLVGIFIALAIIWLAWLIVSFIFRRYQSNWEDALNP